MRTSILLALAAVAVLGAGYGVLAAVAKDAPPAERRAQAQKLMNDGNFNDAYELFSALALDPADDPEQAPNDLLQAISTLQRLGRVDEVDAFREKVIAAHKDNWRLLWAAARSTNEVENYGFIVAGEFYRGGRRGGDGKQVYTVERDRVRALQLMADASKLAEDDPKREG